MCHFLCYYNCFGAIVAKVFSTLVVDCALKAAHIKLTCYVARLSRLSVILCAIFCHLCNLKT